MLRRSADCMAAAGDLLVEGDRVSCFAWKWPLGPPAGQRGDDDSARQFPRQSNPSTTSSRRPCRTAVKVGMIRREPLSRLLSAWVTRDAVIVLLTNDAQSVAPKGQQTLGADNPAYQQVLQMWQRLPQVSESGASLVLPFKVIEIHSSTATVRLDVVMAAPQTFASAALTGKPRSEQVRERVTLGTSLTAAGKLLQVLLGVLPWVVLGALLIVIGVLIARTLSSEQPSVNAMKIQDEEIDISKVIEGQPICILAGENYKPLSQGDPNS